MIKQRELLDCIARKIVVAGREFVSPEFVETNSSLIVFVGERALKILKAEANQSPDIESRYALLEEEMSINAEITPDFYLGIVPIVIRNGQIMVGNDNSRDTIEYALCMRKLKQESLVYNMLLNGTFSCEYATVIATKIARFHNAKLSGNFTHSDRVLLQEFCSLESLEEILQKDLETFEGHKAIFLPTLVTEAQYHKIKGYILKFLKENRDLLTERVHSGYVVPIHGDFRSKNIFIENGTTYMIDRSLRRNIRVSDIVKDPAYLGVDLDAFGFREEKECFFNEYLSKVRDPDFKELLPFYMCHLAIVSVIVNLSHGYHNQIKRYLNVAHNYAR